LRHSSGPQQRVNIAHGPPLGRSPIIIGAPTVRPMKRAAIRRARKLRLRLGGDPADNEYPDKPPLMRWTTFNRLLDKLRAADGIADERLRRVLINAQMLGFGAKTVVS
jgi:hypothetical protein